MTITIKLPPFEVMKCLCSPIAEIPMHELNATTEAFIEGWYDQKSPIGLLPKEIAVRILSCGDRLIAKVQSKSFEKLVHAKMVWKIEDLPKGPEEIVIVNANDQEITTDSHFRECLKKTMEFSAKIRESIVHF